MSIVGVQTGAGYRRVADAARQLAGAAAGGNGDREVAARVPRHSPDRVRTLRQLLAFAVRDEDGRVGHLDAALARETRGSGAGEQYVAAVAHDLEGQVDGMADIAQARDAAGAQLRAFHHARVQLAHAVGVQTRAYAGVEQGFVFQVAHGCDRSLQRAIADAAPAGLERALDRGLAVGHLGGWNRARAAVDDEGWLSQ